MEKLNKLSLPVVILLASVILGGFYYATETSKQSSIERQQQIKIEDEKRIESNKLREAASDTLKKNVCVSEAEGIAQEQYKDFCTKENYCTYKEGVYLVKQFDSAYSRCLQKAGLH